MNHKICLSILIVNIILVAIIVGYGNAETLNAQECDIYDNDFTITPTDVQNNDVFHVVVIGDSIAWGLGLKHDEKYSYLVAKWIADQVKRPVNLRILAHNGAVLNGNTGIESCNQECGSSYPPVGEQIKRIENPENVDLILLSGGINNVNVFNIINVDVSSDKIEGLTNDIGPILENILKDLLIKCPKAKIVQTNYYPIITEPTIGTKGFGFEYSVLYTLALNPPSDLNIKIPLTNDKSITIPQSKVHLPPDGYEDTLIKNSDIFNTTSTIKIRDAIDNVNKYYIENSDKKEKRIVFAPVNFPPSQSYDTEHSLLWKIDVSAQKHSIKGTNDHQWSCRSSHCPCCNDCVEEVLDVFNRDKIIDWFAAIGHPNVEGAKEYNRSIVRKITETWPDWLHPMVLNFEVSPPSVASGESFKISYKVSSNFSEGLKQVELWRKSESSDWQQINTNTLAGETGPVTGSFTDSPSAPGKYWYGVHVVDNAGNWNDERNSNTKGQPRSFDPAEVEVNSPQPITLTLYVHNGSADGPVLVGAEVNGQDAAGMGFSQTTGESGFVVVTGSPGSWRFTVTKPGYAVNSWSQEITASSTKHAYLFAERPKKALAEEWNRTYGNTGDDDLYLFKVTSDGGYIMAYDTYDNNAGRGDARLIKVDSGGNEVWSRTFGGEGADSIESAQQTSDGGTIVAGYTQSFGAKFCDAWLLKVDSNGNEVWNRTFGESGDNRAHSIMQTNDGGYIMAGATDSFGAGSSDIRLENDNVWLIKTDSEGNELWNKTFSRLKEDETAQSVQLTSDGGFLISGETYFSHTEIFNIWLIKVDSEGNEEWTKTFVDSDRAHKQISVQPTSGGDFIVNSLTQSIGKGDLDAWVIKVDSGGNEIWSRTFGGDGIDVINTVRQANDGGYIMAGWTTSFAVDGNYAWLIKIDSNGNEIWNRTISDSAPGPTLNLGVNSVLPTPDGSYILTVTKNSLGIGGEDALLIKTDSEGQEIWRTKFGSNADEDVFSINPTLDGGYILEGYRFSNGGGRGDIWLVKVAPG